jgi:hypothetical protein
MSDEDVQALVVDNGSGMCKVRKRNLLKEWFRERFSVDIEENGVLWPIPP